MKICTTLLFSASFFCILGCTESKQTETATAEHLETSTATSADLNDKNSPTTTETPAAAPVTTASAMNPPHGQPGHDCGIPVGAPLNSKNNAAPAPQTNVAPQSTTPITGPILSAPAVSTNASGTNPPHGQPGHDCSIAVGAPLKK